MRDVVRPMPLQLVRRIVPALTHVARVQRFRLRSDPGPQMDAVRDVRDRYLVGGCVGPDDLPHLPAHRTVQPADTIAPRRETQRECGHAETGFAFERAEPDEIVPWLLHLPDVAAKV